MGLIPVKKSLLQCEKLTASAFCRYDEDDFFCFPPFHWVVVVNFRLPPPD